MCDSGQAATSQLICFYFVISSKINKMDNHQNLVNCCICGVSDKPIISLKVEYSHQICELLGKNDIFLQENSAQQINKQSWNNCYHCLDLISKLKISLSKQAQILDQIKEKIANGERIILYSFN